MLGKYVRDERVLTLEEAVRKMTSQAAIRVGVTDRGILRPGMLADITDLRPGDDPRRRDLRGSEALLARASATCSSTARRSSATGRSRPNVPAGRFSAPAIG